MRRSPPRVIGHLIGHLIGHRGAAGLAPENTVAGIHAARAHGACWVELDVRLTRDGRPVLLHDETLERTTDGRGRVARTPLAAVRKLDAGRWFGDAFAGVRVPSLDEAIAALAQCRLGAVFEIKTSDADAARCGHVIAEAIVRGWPASQPAPILSSFDEAALIAAARAQPRLVRALLVDGLPADWRRRLRATGASAVHMAADRASPPVVRSVGAAGVRVRCYIVNDPGAAERLFAMGVSGVFTDRPDRLAGVGPAGRGARQAWPRT
jgi:glycerophosphoryl diester phosphodiesterase